MELFCALQTPDYGFIQRPSTMPPPVLMAVTQLLDSKSA
jgi:hypothetical protein